MIPEYVKRETKTFANYRVKALQLYNSYKSFKDDLTKNIRAEISKEILNNSSAYHTYSVNLTKIMEKFKDEELEKEILKLNAEYSDKLVTLFDLNQRLSNDEDYYRETWLLFDNKVHAKELTGLYYETCDFNHDKEMNDEEYSEYMVWLFEILNDFFLNFKSSTTFRKQTI